MYIKLEICSLALSDKLRVMALLGVGLTVGLGQDLKGYNLLLLVLFLSHGRMQETESLFPPATLGAGPTLLQMQPYG